MSDTLADQIPGIPIIARRVASGFAAAGLQGEHHGLGTGSLALLLVAVAGAGLQDGAAPLCLGGKAAGHVALLGWFGVLGLGF